MAMLMTNEVFARTWALEPPADGVLAGGDGRRPRRLHVHRRGLLGHGVRAHAAGLRPTATTSASTTGSRTRTRPRCAGTCRPTSTTSAGCVRFIENHDEPRAATAFGPRARAAAVVMSTVPGARLYHDGQFEGLRTKIPVFLARGPVEPADEDLRAFYARLVGLRGRRLAAGGRQRLAGQPLVPEPPGLVVRRPPRGRELRRRACAGPGRASPARPCTDLLTGTRFEAHRRAAVRGARRLALASAAVGGLGWTA